MNKLFISIALLFLSTYLGAQQKYWIYFKDKTDLPEPGSDYYDIPVSDIYLDSLRAINLNIQGKSKWLNAVTAKLDDASLPALKEFSFIKSISTVRAISTLGNGINKQEMSLALKQIRADTLLSLDLNGDGVKIGIIDGGFLNADKRQELEPLIEKGKLKAYRNFVEEDLTDPFVGSRRNSDDHGTNVWAMIGGFEPDVLRYHGIASGATYYLARTDQGDKEHRGEEDNWIEAIEWLHDQGVKLVNSSVGYSTGYDNPQENYTPTTVDGKTAAITLAARIASEKKGMTIVIAAGNDGNNAFEVISIPADARGVISVGATNSKFWTKQGYSSIGPEHLDDVKPEIACYSSRGTSFSAPIITGVLACIMQAHPELNNQQLSELLKRSAHLYPFPNNYLGYGVPDIRRLLKMVSSEDQGRLHEKVWAPIDEIELKLQSQNIVLFHKKDDRNVILQERGTTRNNILYVTRKKNCSFTTVATPHRVIEVIWP